MPQLTRQVSPQSIHSDWSDSKPPGATISIHAVAKPLMRLMYHQQASKYMKQDRDLPLSRENINMYLSWLEYKYVGTATKKKILEYIAKKKLSDADAFEVAQTLLLNSDVVQAFLQAVDTQLQIYACDVLVNLATNTSSAPVVLQLNPCGRLVSFLRGLNTTLTARALKALEWIADRPDGAQAVVEAGALNLVEELFGCSETEIRTGTCDVLTNLAWEESTSGSVIRANPSRALVSLLRDPDPEVGEAAAWVLAKIAYWAEGAQVVIDARLLDLLDVVLKLPDQSPTCEVLQSLARHKSTTGFVLSANLCQHIVALLALGHIPLDALPILRSIATSLEGALAVVNAGTLQVLDTLLESENWEVRGAACGLMGDLAFHVLGSQGEWPEAQLRKLVRLLSDNEHGVVATAMRALRRTVSRLQDVTLVIDAGVLPVVVALLRDQNVKVIRNAVRTLASTALWADGALAVCEAEEPGMIDQLLESPDGGVQAWTCNLLGNLGRFKATSTTARKDKRCQKLVELWREGKPGVADHAAYALAKLAFWADGSVAVVEAGVLQGLDAFAHCAIPGVRRWTCEMLENLARHECTAVALLKINPCQRLVALLRDQESIVVGSALRALASIALHADGALAISDSEAPIIVNQLLECSESGVRDETCNLLGDLASFEAAAAAAWRDNRCHKLVELSHDRIPVVATSAVYALAKMAYWPDGAMAVVEAGVLQLLGELVGSSIVGIHRWVAVLLVNLARHPPLTTTVLAANPCERLTTLLHDNDSDIIGLACEALSLISQSLDGAQAIMEAGTNSMIDNLLESSNTNVRMWICGLVGNLACLTPVVPAVWGGNRVQKFMELSRNDVPAVAYGAVFALSQIAGSVGGATVVVEGGILQICNQLLESGIVDVRRFACVLLQNVASHESTAGTLLTINPCRRLVALLRDPETIVVESAVCALACIALHADGALAVTEAEVPTVIDRLLDSSENGVRECTCSLLCNLSHFEAPATAAWSDIRCQKLMDLSHENTATVAYYAAYALAKLAYWSESAAAVVAAGGLQLLKDLAESSITGVHRLVAVLLAHLTRHSSLTAAVLAANPCKKLIALSQDDDLDIVEPACEALTWISDSPEGAQAVLDAGINNILDQLLESSNTNVLTWICGLVGKLARLPPVVPALWEGNRCQTLVELLRNDPVSVAPNAVYALALIAYWAEGLRTLTCVMLENLARHEPTLTSLLGTNSCERLVNLLRDSEPSVVESAVRALAFIASQANGALAVCEAGAPEAFDQLLESSESGIRNWTCNLLGDIARFETTETAAWNVHRCRKLVQLSRDDPLVGANALCALTKIAYCADGAIAVVEGGALQQLGELFESAFSDVQQWTAKMLVPLAYHSTVAAVLAANPCRGLVTLIRGGHPDVIGPASEALARIAKSIQGAQAAVEAGVTSTLDPLLQSSNTDVRMWTCNLIGSLCSHLPEIPAIWEGNRCNMVVELSHDVSPTVSASALYALSQFALSVDGAAAVIDAGALKRLDELMQCTSKVRKQACYMVGSLARHQCHFDALLSASVCEELVQLLGDDDPDVVCASTIALSTIAELAEGAQAVLEAGILSSLDDFLLDPNGVMRYYMSNLLYNLASFECCVDAFLEADLIPRLVGLLSDSGNCFYANAVYVLGGLSRWPKAARIIAETDILTHVSELLESPRYYMSDLLYNLASFECCVDAFLEADLIPRLVGVLSDSGNGFYANAVYNYWSPHIATSGSTPA
ncbi:hypothetical protein MVEN_00293200 [Mycena venus]|uniref:ARM repeat-containing protein n=1 Tax=Mycena venus TaxID=2733690 RepID=A0A8H7DBR3_9AGAR|nr:hypothetical protein MVEN_00293200 [Mycena venus]